VRAGVVHARTIQSVAASNWFSQLEPPELYEIAPSFRLSPEERELIETAAKGTPARHDRAARVGHCTATPSPGEYAMANTDVLADVDDGNTHGAAYRAAI
jgi:hypothetical protein